MSKKIFYFLLGLGLFLSRIATAQHDLKPVSYALEAIMTNVPKERLIRDIRFIDGDDQMVNVVRFDHIGKGLYPLVLSSKPVIQSDSLGVLSAVMEVDSLVNILKMLDNTWPKVNEWKIDKILIRVTYRFDGRLEQYFVTNEKIVMEFLKMVEKKLLWNGNDDVIELFNVFVSRTGLRVVQDGVFKWKY
ncbi:MAG: hypothetical protein ACK5DD_14305 [Cyclobacteriaceae bacterium]|jgi:hypothetical protein